MLRASGGSVRRGDDTTRSPTTISPAVGSTKPAIRRNVVVLPQPDGPSRQTSEPCSMRSDTSSTAANLSYRLVRFRSSTDATRSLLAASAIPAFPCPESPTRNPGAASPAAPPAPGLAAPPPRLPAQRRTLAPPQNAT